MNEELSRLLAGELESDAADALFARIAREPELALAWERMMALPELLASLPMEAPPSALKARLYDMTAPVGGTFAALSAGVPSPYVDSAPDLFDPAPYAPDPLEDTLDADRRVLRSVPLDDRPQRALPRPSRRVWAGAIGLLAMAAAAALAIRTPAPPAAPAQVELPSGDSVVDGDVVVQAGDVRVHVDGRARITVEPAATNAALVVIDAPTVSTYTTPAAPRDALLSVERAGVSGQPATTGADIIPVTTTVGTFVRVQVERGVAIIGVEGGSTRLAAGESRSYGERRQATPERAELAPTVADASTATPDAVPVQPVVTSKDPHRNQLAARTTVARVPRDDERPTGEVVTADTVSEHLESLAFGGVSLVSLRCDALPCVAVYSWDGDRADWESMLIDDLVSSLPGELAIQQVSAELLVAGEKIETTSIAIGAELDGSEAAEGLDSVESERDLSEPEAL